MERRPGDPPRRSLELLDVAEKLRDHRANACLASAPREVIDPAGGRYWNIAGALPCHERRRRMHRRDRPGQSRAASGCTAVGHFRHARPGDSRRCRARRRTPDGEPGHRHECAGLPCPRGSPTRSPTPSARRRRSPSRPTGACSSRPRAASSGSPPRPAPCSPRRPRPSRARAPNSERGLLGVAVDPAFASNHFIYLYYTTSATGACRNRVSRWVLSDANAATGRGRAHRPDPLDRGQPQRRRPELRAGRDALRQRRRRRLRLRHADQLRRGRTTRPATTTSCSGKILRIDRDGNIPASGNPFTGPGTGRCNVNGSTTAGNWCQETWAWGLRNPFRFAVRPEHPRPRLHQRRRPGPSRGDRRRGRRRRLRLERARGHLRQSGARTRQLRQRAAGRHDQPDLRLRPSDGCVSITGGAFVPNGISWPAEYLGKYLFADYGCGKIFRLDPSGPGFIRVDFATGPRRRAARPTWSSARPDRPRRCTTRPTPVAARCAGSASPPRTPRPTRPSRRPRPRVRLPWPSTSTAAAAPTPTRATRSSTTRGRSATARRS